MSNVIRREFTVTKRVSGTYDVSCRYCGLVAKAWDYRSSALSVGYFHVANQHMAAFAHKALWVESDA